MMTNVHVHGETIHIELSSMDKLWALKGSVEIPLASVSGVSVADPDLKPHGLRAPGTHVPGFYRAGTWRGRGTKEFWNVRDTSRSVVFELHDYEFTRVVVEVDDPATVVAAVEHAGAVVR